MKRTKPTAAKPPKPPLNPGTLKGGAKGGMKSKVTKPPGPGSFGPTRNY